MTQALRIVIVEDEAVVLMQLELMLEDAGHEVVGTAMSAGEAIRVIDEKCPELVLLDLHLNDGSSGLDVAAVLKRLKDLMFVFLTANARMLADDFHGAAAVIAKPFNEKSLAGAIDYLEECVHRPPPLSALPHIMRLAPPFSAQMEAMRRA